MAQFDVSPVSILRRGPPQIVGAGETRATRMTGEYDVATVGALSAMLSSAIVFEHDDLVVDLSEVSFMDAATIGVIVRANAFLGVHGRSLWLRDPSRCARRILNICDLDALIELAADAQGSTTSALALESWVAVPPVAAERDRSRPARIVPATVRYPDGVAARPKLSPVGSTTAAWWSHGAAAMTRATVSGGWPPAFADPRVVGRRRWDDARDQAVVSGVCCGDRDDRRRNHVDEW